MLAVIISCRMARHGAVDLIYILKFTMSTDMHASSILDILTGLKIDEALC